MNRSSLLLIFFFFAVFVIISCKNQSQVDADETSIALKFQIIASQKFVFNNFVDCNMAEAWIADTFRIFPGKYGEDTVWGRGVDFRFASNTGPDETFQTPAAKFIAPTMPPNATIGQPGLHGAVWFETVYQDTTDVKGKTLFAIYHNENYPENFPYDTTTGEGYINKNWPEGLRGPKSSAAVCRIGVMKSTDGGWNWENKGILIEDLQPRLILKPNNTSKTFAGGVGDPSAVASDGYLYLFYGEYGYPDIYDEKTYNPNSEWRGQCISIARIRLKDLDNPTGKAQRWNGTEFAATYTIAGRPIDSLQITRNEGGGPASDPRAGFYWGPSVSWNDYLECWVMLMAKATGPSWAGSSIYISFNRHKDLTSRRNSQDWSKPQLLLEKPGRSLWYPSLQPMNTPDDKDKKRTCLRLGQRARLFVKSTWADSSEYASEYTIEFSE